MKHQASNVKPTTISSLPIDCVAFVQHLFTVNQSVVALRQRATQSRVLRGMRRSFGAASLRLGSKLSLPNSAYSTGTSTVFRTATVLPIITNIARIPQHVQFSTLQSTSPTTSPSKVKPWLDKTRSVEGRVQEIIEAPRLHAADFYDAAMQDLVKKCCQLGNLEGMQLAQDVLDRLLVEKRRLQATGIVISVPVDLIQTLLYGWAVLASTLRVAQDRMREVLQMAIEEAKQDDLMIAKTTETVTLSEKNSHQPTVDLFNTYLRGLANAAKHQQPQAALNAEATLYEMAEYNRSLGWHTKPNTRSYTHVIHAFANTRHLGSGQRAYNLLRKMQVVHSSEKEAYLQDYGVPYNVQNPAANKRRIVTPDAAVYTSTMKALINSPKGPEKAIDLLNEAIQSEGVRLDESLFTITMKSLTSMIEVENNAKQRIKLAKQAEDILLMMTKHAENNGFSDDKNGNEPTFQTDRSGPLLAGYNACMDAWSRSYCKEAAPRCESMLHDMINGDAVVPNTISFNTCLYGKNITRVFWAFVRRVVVVIAVSHTFFLQKHGRGLTNFTPTLRRGRRSL